MQLRQFRSLRLDIHKFVGDVFCEPVHLLGDSFLGQGAPLVVHDDSFDFFHCSADVLHHDARQGTDFLLLNLFLLKIEVFNRLRWHSLLNLVWETQTFAPLFNVGTDHVDRFDQTGQSFHLLRRQEAVQ